MRERFKLVLLIVTVVGLMLLVACGDDSGKDNNENQNNSSNTSGEKLLGLGESAVIESILGDFEVTIESFEIHESYQGEESEYEDHVFVIVDFTVENFGYGMTLHTEDVIWKFSRSEAK